MEPTSCWLPTAVGEASTVLSDVDIAALGILSRGRFDTRKVRSGVWQWAAQHGTVEERAAWHLLAVGIVHAHDGIYALTQSGIERIEQTLAEVRARAGHAAEGGSPDA